MTAPTRIVLLELASILFGCDAAILDRNLVLHSLLHPYVKKKASGYYLASSKHRQLIQVSFAIT